jgi:hypothetical protein
VESETAAQDDQLIELSRLSPRLQAIADKERERAEAHYARWNIIFYVLYIFGWLITIYGIVTGASGEAAIEKVAEEL